MALGKVEEMSSLGILDAGRTHKSPGCRAELRDAAAPPAVGHICSWRHCSALCSLCPRVWLGRKELESLFSECHATTRPRDTKIPAVSHRLPVTCFSL